jgi:hypothetical protein
MIDDWIDKVVSIYFWGVVGALIIQLCAMTFYMIGFGERAQYQTNLNRIGLSWDPIYFRLYTLDEFKHTFSRYWLKTLIGFFDCFLSWISVASRVYRIMKVREVHDMLTPEQKQAGYSLRNFNLTKDQVLEKVKILDPDLVKQLAQIAASSEIASAPDRFTF